MVKLRSIGDNFYSRENARIIEELLEVKNIRVYELYGIFFLKNMKCNLGDANFPQQITLENLLTYFNKTITEWAKSHYKRLFPEDDEFSNVEIWEAAEKDVAKYLLPDGGIVVSTETRVCVEQAVSALIIAKILPKKILRLPRLSSLDCGFEPIDTYYPEYAYIEDPRQIVAVSENNLPSPKLFNYGTVKDRWLKLGTADNQIELFCMDNRIGVYIKASEDSIVTAWINGSTQLSLYTTFNCGNPYYLKRLLGFERLNIKNDPYGFDLKNLFVKKSLKIDSHLLCEVQATDLETKYHIRRTLKSISPSSRTEAVCHDIKLEDLYFLKDEVINLEEELRKSTLENDKNKSNKQHKPKQVRQHELNELIMEVHSSSIDKSAGAIWKELKKLANHEHSTLSKVDRWGEPNAKIHWVNRSSVPKSITRKRFENIIADLNNPK